MESVLEKFKNRAIDTSKTFGGDIPTGSMSYGTSGGVVYRGSEFAVIYPDGCIWTYLATSSGNLDGQFIC